MVFSLACNRLKFLLTALLAFSLIMASALCWSDFTIRLDANGYHPLAEKKLILDNIPNGLQPDDIKLKLYDPEAPGMLPFLKGKVVYKIETIRRQSDGLKQGPGSEHWVADFSDFKQSGDYLLLINDTLPTSAEAIPLKVSEFLYWDAMKPLMKAFYLHRSGQILNEPETGISLGLSHPNDALVMDSQNGETYRKDTAGGWYNGSDFNKYTTTTALTIAQLLSAYELNPKTVRFFEMGYPNSEPVRSVPDFLYEVRYGLDWLFTMQRNDGAFYRKVAGKKKPDVALPEDDEQTRYLYGITTQDTALAVGTLAIAGRNYKRNDYSYAIKALIAAERGWRYLNKNQTWQADINVDDDSGSREYLNPKGDLNYRFWAATELYTATNKAIYHNFMKQHYQQISIEPVNWENPTLLGIANYLNYAKKTDPELSRYFKTHILRGAKILLGRIEENPYHHTLTEFDYASNVQLLQHLFFLTTAYQQTEEPLFIRQAANALHFLYGINPLGKVFLTGDAENAVKQPHNVLVEGLKTLIPGLLVSGPNAEAKDGKTPVDLGPLSYKDRYAALDSNASDLFYNAALINILSHMNEAFNQIQQNQSVVAE